MKKIFFLLILILPFWLYSQQIADTSYNPTILNPEYEPGSGPVVFIDEGHHNFHTKDGRYKAFALLVERDGYQVKSYTGEFNKEQLSKGKILVISNALNELNVEEWYLPNPSAFTKKEIKTVKKWVRKGGSLFLIADHMPMAGAAKDLATTFDFEFTNGFVFDTINRGPSFFSIQDKSLIKSTITSGRNSTEKVEQVTSFTGQGFKLAPNAIPILVFNKNYVNFLPDTAWVFKKETKSYNVEGWSQGAYMKVKKGRIVMFGEAAMFTAQLAGPNQIKAGMNRDDAKENYKLLLNIIHWLDGKLD